MVYAKVARKKLSAVGINDPVFKETLFTIGRSTRRKEKERGQGSIV